MVALLRRASDAAARDHGSRSGRDGSALAKTTTERISQEEQLRKSGPLYKTTSGYIQVSPLFSVVSTLRERELKLLREFGMTPSSRTRVQVAREEKTQN